MDRDPALIAARPSFKVGKGEQPALAARLVALDIRDDADGLARCEAEFGNWGPPASGEATGFLYFDRSLLEFGQDFIVRVDGQTLFDGRVMALEGRFHEGRPPTLRVWADDRLQDLRMTRRTRSFADCTDADLASQIAAEHGLTAEVDAPGPRHRQLAQLNQSDLALLHERARAVDAELWLNGRHLHFQRRSARDGGRLELAYGAGLVRFEARADLASQRSEFVVGGWDVSAKGAVRATASDTALAAELGGDESGIAILRQALGERRESLVHADALSQEMAQAQADMALRLAARRFVRGQGCTALPQPGLRVGCALDLQGLGPLFSGRWTATAVHHRFEATTGLRTEFEAERPGLGRAH